MSTGDASNYNILCALKPL